MPSNGDGKNTGSDIEDPDSRQGGLLALGEVQAHMMLVTEESTCSSIA